MNKLMVLEKANLPQLKQLYEAYHPLHVATTTTIGHFIKRFEKKPEWTKLVKFWCSNDSWKQTGAFVIVNAHDDHILCNTLEPAPYKSLHAMLDQLHYDRPMLFRVPLRLTPIVLDVIRKHNLEITHRSSYKNFYYSMNNQSEIRAPPGFYFDSLNQSHVEQIDSVWAYRDLRSYEYISNCVAQNPSTGLFHRDTGELVAWTVQDEAGAAGNLGVLEKYRRNGYGELVCLIQYTQMGKDVTGLVALENKASIELMTKNGVQFVDNTECLMVCPKVMPKVLGRL